jgi:hypothetical protein
VSAKFIAPTRNAPPKIYTANIDESGENFFILNAQSEKYYPPTHQLYRKICNRNKWFSRFPPYIRKELERAPT